MAEEIDVVVIGAGQAGLATSHELEQRGVEHVVLEADVPGSAWLGRWDGFTLVGQNHTVRLPGAPYTGDDPAGLHGTHRDRGPPGRLGRPAARPRALRLPRATAAAA